MLPDIRLRREGNRNLPVLVWRLPQAMRAISSSPHGGGVGSRRWVVNAQVPPSYSRRDPDHHLSKLGVSLGLPGRGVGMLTSADVRLYRSAEDDGVAVVATVGLGAPIRAAASEEDSSSAEGSPAEGSPLEGSPVKVGTINIVAFVPQRLSDAALVNAVSTSTEAKVQALEDAGLSATGTATDALCVLCPDEGNPATFGGPRSIWGARLARAVHAAVLSGALTR